MVTELTKENIDDQLKGPIIVDFWASWCGPCKSLAPVFEEVSKDFKDLKFAKLNMEENQDLAGKYEIQSIPCLILFKDGKEVGRILGFMPKDALKAEIKKLL